MATTVVSAALVGVRAVPIQVEVDLLNRLPQVTIVGRAANVVKESSDRIRSALAAFDESFPRRRVVINLAPANLPKSGTALDLPMALGVLAADGKIPEAAVRGVMAAGELSLGGQLRAVRGAVAMALAARESGLPLILPRQNAVEASIVRDAEIWAADDLGEVLSWLRSETDPRLVGDPGPPTPEAIADMSDVRGQTRARRALEIAAAGAHHVLLTGPPGCGKSMLARRLPGILPPLTFEEALQCTQIHSAAGLEGLVHHRPFRAPHANVTVAGLVGDAQLKPGEIPLAHHGVLFLDEAPEFPRSALEALRQPLQDGTIKITRAAGSAIFPAAITLVLAANPCPCGYAGTQTPCHCSEHQIQRYQRRLSGPILDRIDLQLDLEPLSPSDLLSGSPGEASATVRERVIEARERQRVRGQSHPNGQLPDSELDRHAALTRDTREILLQVATAHGLSARSTRRIHRVARTLADLRGAVEIDVHDIAEGATFRSTAR